MALYSEQNKDHLSIFREKNGDLLCFVHDIILEANQEEHTGADEKIIKLIIDLSEHFTSEILIGMYIDHTYNNWERIFDKDTSLIFGNEKNILIPDNFPSVDIEVYTRVFQNPLFVTKRDMEVLWSLLHQMIKRCILYIHELRGPRFYGVNGSRKKGYSNKVFEYVPLKRVAKKFNIELEW